MTKEVFLLSYTKYGDHDAVLHCFCKENGSESFFVKGIYSSKNKKKAFLFPLNHLEIQISEKSKTLLNVLKIEQKNTGLFTSDIRKNTILFFVADFLNQVLRHENQNLDFFSEIILFLEELHSDNFQAHLIFMYNVLKILGLQPLPSGGIFLNPETGTFANIESHHYFTKDISETWRQLISARNPYTIKMSRSCKQHFLDSVLLYYHYHFTDFREPRSLEIVKDIF